MGRRVVLVTGGAGFIGMHVTLELVRAWPGCSVVVLDNFNPYYDVRLKLDRAARLAREPGVKVYRASVEDEALLSSLFREHNFTHVVHLAAQAGVYQSTVDPLAYITANVEGFLSLLSVLQNYKV